ncbi:MAG: glycerol-3-phosphate 1-O-acyltransferase PlsY [Gammaproteobacteria bacterium]|nr:MAG: glycerol-3-phosphate 1-O-acyltransferase PlsY [Gammaproteobacteria bacterium]
MLTDAILVIGAYLLGSISSAIIVCKIMGQPDPRTLGSNNPGATNVLRYAGKKAAAFTLSGDVLKGLTPVLIATLFSSDARIIAAVAFAAFIGHLYPLFFGFRGGKGVATAFGVLLGLSWLVGLAVLATWLVVARLFHTSSLSAIAASLLTPLYLWLFMAQPAYLVMGLAMSTLLIWRHRSNIRNLIRGEEGGIGNDAEDE